ncbi:MAG: ABC transporter ATP-binding protein [Eubacteriaceae bacterium]|jgi:ABC-2 type transport system ATP-binding protein|nr:ABC transporter ATP-binding protein [Eubacteriaceae bacterium]
MELLKLENVSKKIKNKDIVKSISLTVNSGEIVGFVGPNGAGKTTTIKMIMGLFSLTQGRIAICGYDIQTDFEQAMKTVGGVIENPDLYLKISGRKNLEYFSSFYGEAAFKNIDPVVSLVKMSQRIDERMSSYSLGMKQRIGLAQALLHMPSLLILDEPTNGLDPIGIKELRETLKSLSKDSGIGVFISSHLLSEIEIICDRVYIINNGEIIEHRVLASDSSNPIKRYRFEVGETELACRYFEQEGMACQSGPGSVFAEMQRDAVPEAIKGLANYGVKLYSIELAQRSLEADFIDLTQTNDGQIF